MPRIMATNNGELAAALDDARPGDEIIASGRFSGTFSVDGNGTQQNPIVIRPDNGAIFAGARINLNGDHIIFTGMSLIDSSIAVTGDRNSIVGNTIADAPGAAIVVTGGGSYNTLAYNDISEQQHYGIQISTARGNISYGNIIENNYIHSFANTRKNESEAIQVSQTASHYNFNTATIIRDNLIEKVNVDSEVISLKSSNIKVIGNTFLEADASVSIRHGSNNLIQNNFIENIKNGIRVHGDDHQIIGNIVVGGRYGKIELMAGTTTNDNITNATAPSARNVLVAGNKVDNAIVVGKQSRDENLIFPVTNANIIGNQGRIELLNENNTQQSAGPLLTNGVEKLSPSDVGPGALPKSWAYAAPLSDPEAAPLPDPEEESTAAAPRPDGANSLDVDMGTSSYPASEVSVTLQIDGAARTFTATGSFVGPKNAAKNLAPVIDADPDLEAQSDARIITISSSKPLAFVALDEGGASAPPSSEESSPPSEDGITGTDGANKLEGTRADDKIYGLGGDDLLVGKRGNDILLGGTGKDVLKGGTGNDVFRYTSADESPAGAANRDELRGGDGFDGPGRVTGDLIDLSAIASFVFIGEKSFDANATGQVRVYKDGSSTIVAASTDADTAAELEIAIFDGTIAPSDYSTADFIL